jgi:type IV pilus assembly protein PilB
MGVPSFNIATSVSLIIAQRLGRRLCSACKQPADLPKQVLLDAGLTEEQIAEGTFFQPVGCDACNKGYKGRVGIYEVVKITPAISKIIMDNGNSLEIAAVAKDEGFNNLRTSALEKVAQGITSLEEANRVTAD